MRAIVDPRAWIDLHNGDRACSDRIQLWRGMSGARGAEFAALVRQFNASQKAYGVIVVYQGGDGVALSAALAVQRSRAPDIVQVDQVDTGRLPAAYYAVRPL